MASNDLYSSLIEIGLGDFLKTMGGGNIIEEKWIVNLGFFVSNLTDEKRKILKSKIEKKKNETHSQHNDVFNEISIACAFYDDVDFLEENNISMPDFCSDSANVEVKTINNSDVEKSRLQELDKGPRCEIYKYDENMTKNFKILSVQAIIKKFENHIEKAKRQLGAGGGHIWVVYTTDSPPTFHEDEKLKLEIENKFDEIIETSPIEYKVRYIHFGKLRGEIKNKSN